MSAKTSQVELYIQTTAPICHTTHHGRHHLRLGISVCDLFSGMYLVTVAIGVLRSPTPRSKFQIEQKTKHDFSGDINFILILYCVYSTLLFIAIIMLNGKVL